VNQLAADGQVWVCCACGKRSKDRYGEQAISRGWDESCMLNAVLCREDKLVLQGETVVGVEDGGIVQEETSSAQ